MSRRTRPSPSSFMRNLRSGSYNPLERARLVVLNTLRKGGGRGCCGHYGDPGC